MQPIPKTLNDVITLRKDEMQFGVAFDAEIADYTRPIDATVPIKGWLYDWQIVAVREFQPPELDHYVHTLSILGWSGDTKRPIWLESVETINIDQGLVVVHDPEAPDELAVYKFGDEQSQHEPSHEALHHLCVRLHDSEHAAEFCSNFGVPNVTRNFVLAVLEA